MEIGKRKKRNKIKQQNICIMKMHMKHGVYVVCCKIAFFFEVNAKRACADVCSLAFIRQVTGKITNEVRKG